MKEVRIGLFLIYSVFYKEKSLVDLSHLNTRFVLNTSVQSSRTSGYYTFISLFSLTYSTMHLPHRLATCLLKHRLFLTARLPPLLRNGSTELFMLNLKIHIKIMCTNAKHLGQIHQSRITFHSGCHRYEVQTLPSPKHHSAHHSRTRS